MERPRGTDRNDESSANKKQPPTTQSPVVVVVAQQQQENPPTTTTETTTTYSLLLDDLDDSSLQYSLEFLCGHYRFVASADRRFRFLTVAMETQATREIWLQENREEVKEDGVYWLQRRATWTLWSGSENTTAAISIPI